MREVKRSALVNRDAAQLFALINDIEAYPQFVPWCTHARVLSRTPSEIVATLGVRQGALQGEFTTRNSLEPEQRVSMHLLSGPFRTLEGEWRLQPLAQGCEVSLTVRFAFKSRLTGLMFEPLFARTIESLVDAFVQRARAGP
ncbi:MAG: type II toxin-antitoxin system RatA family toxin [Gammaproteobacteria bacterium]|nr:type II toxin-antitoxin system RatA family toxin [Gammaproteobacteria bacterium]MBV9620203.1 type II toxin-antitoxin system RatA family toxin [Gammaproteobacteria bacterium]